jgi:hypothetical protein
MIKDILSPTGVTWVDELLLVFETKTNGKLTVNIGGVNVTTVLGGEIANFFLENKSFLVALGKQAFIEFLMLINEKKEEAAMTFLISKMSAEDIIIKMGLSENELARHNAMRDQSYQKLKQFAIGICTTLVSKIIIGLLTGGITAITGTV